MLAAPLIFAAAAVIPAPTPADLTKAWHDWLAPVLTVEGAMSHCAVVKDFEAIATNDPAVFRVKYGFGEAILRYEDSRWVWQSGDKPPCDVIIQKNSEG